jgi:cytochrome c oxidase subunit 1
MFYTQGRNNTLVKYWLVLSIIALALAGLFAVLLVLGRSPHVQDIIPVANIFHKALTVHVNLSVLVWFTAMSVTLWHVFTPNKAGIIDYITLLGAAGGMALFCIAPFISEGDALINNYIPIIESKPFILGIWLYIASCCAQAIVSLCRLLSTRRTDHPFSALIHQAVIYSTLIYIASCIAFALSYVNLKPHEADLSPANYYEMLFWGGGHILQLLFVQVMGISWMWFLSLGGYRPKHYALWLIVISLNYIFSILSLLIYIQHGAQDPEHITYFTKSMIVFGGISSVFFATPAIRMIFTRWTSLKQSQYHWVLICSMVMFAAGGILAFMIDGVNTIIPAHYHGSIVAVTLAMMGVAFILLQKLGYSHKKPTLLALQPIIYTIGQLMHISGLAWSGGYGALRKTPGAMESIEGQAAMGLMGIGGLFSIIGGFMFVIICVMCINGRKASV